MLGNTVKTTHYYNQCCIEQKNGSQTTYIPIASMSVIVKEGAKIPSNIQVTPLNQELYDENQNIINEDYSTFYNDVMNDLKGV